MRTVGASESAQALAGEMIAEVGRMPAFGYMLGCKVGAGNWHRMKQVARLAAAVLFVRA